MGTTPGREPRPERPSERSPLKPGRTTGAWRQHYITQVTMLAALYFLAGKLGLLLAIPPGFATAIWPASGVALVALLLYGYRLWPGVLLGSFLVNIGTSFDTSSAAVLLKSVLIASSIGIGASMQAVLGAWLIRRFVGFPTLLLRAKEVLQFLTLGGPISCLTSATWGVTTLSAGGLTPWVDYLFSWWTWWIGDAIGVLIVAPLGLIWAGSPQAIWRVRRVSVALPLGITLAAVIVLFAFASEWEQRRIKLEYAQQAAVVGDALEKSLDRYLEVLRGIESLYASAHEVSREDFQRFVARPLARVPGIQALSWNPRIAHEERAAWEEAARQDGYPEFAIVEFDQEGRLVPAGDRPEYITVYYIEPHRGNEDALGYDVWSHPTRRAALEAARDSGEPFATARIDLAQETGTQAGVLVFLPIYALPHPPATLRERRESLQGYVTGVYRVGDVVESALAGIGLTHMVARLHDDSAQDEGRLLTEYHLGGSQGEPGPGLDQALPPNALIWTAIYEFGGRKWTLVVTADSEYAATQRIWSAWLVLAGGLLFAGLLGGFQLVLTGRAAELAQTNSNLQQEISDHQQAQAALAESEARFRALAEHAPEAIVILDADKCHLVDANQNAERLFDLERKILLQKCLADLSPPTQPGGAPSAELAQMYIRQALEGAVPTYEWMHRTATERDVLCEVRLVRLPAAERSLVRSSITDITARKRAEALLFAEKERALVTLHAIGDAVVVTDADGTVEYLNPVAETLTGWPLDEAKGQSVETVFRVVNETTREPEPAAVRRCLAEGRAVRLADHSVLINRTGREYAIEDSAAPIRGRAGERLGAVLVFKDATDMRRMAQSLAHQAAHDALTGLANRREFEHRLDRALASVREHGTPHALCYLDLDQFKVINDTVGHTAGDELLKQVAGLLRGNIRARDSLARLGGDEFSLVLENCPLNNAVQIAETLVATLREFRFHWEGRTFGIGVSIGLVPITAEVANIAQLLTLADLACYTAKDLGRNRVYLHQEQDTELARRHTEILRAAELRGALEEGRFRLYAQPILPLSSDEGEPLQYELLLRLVEPNGETLLPGAFIPAAERYGLMAAIDRWVIHTAFQCCAKSIRGSPIAGIAINLSGNSLNDETLLDFVRQELYESGIPPRRVCFEITETAAINTLTQATRFIVELKKNGCRFALDDFGSGLSSFTYLKNLPVDYVKIDGSFVRDMLDDPVDRAMVTAINQIGHVLGMQTIAEWAESEAIVAHLKEMGVDFVQGYAVGAPAPLEDT